LSGAIDIGISHSLYNQQKKAVLMKSSIFSGAPDFPVERKPFKLLRFMLICRRHAYKIWKFHMQISMADGCAESEISPLKPIVPNCGSYHFSRAILKCLFSIFFSQISPGDSVPWRNGLPTAALAWQVKIDNDAQESVTIIVACLLRKWQYISMKIVIFSFEALRMSEVGRMK
jgi:hypothetical protein